MRKCCQNFQFWHRKHCQTQSIWRMWNFQFHCYETFSFVNIENLRFSNALLFLTWGNEAFENCKFSMHWKSSIFKSFLGPENGVFRGLPKILWIFEVEENTVFRTTKTIGFWGFWRHLIIHYKIVSYKLSNLLDIIHIF